MTDTDQINDAKYELNSMGVFYINGIIDEDSLQELHEQLLLNTITHQHEQVTLIINSLGGHTNEGWKFIDLMELSKLQGIKIKTISTGMICSMGVVIAAAGTKGLRYATSNSELMVHEASLGFGHMGKVHDILDTTEFMQHEQARSVAFWLQNSKYKSEAQLKKKLLKENRDNWLTCKQAIEHGIIDGIIGKEKCLITGGKKKTKKNSKKK